MDKVLVNELKQELAHALVEAPNHTALVEHIKNAQAITESLAEEAV